MQCALVTLLDIQRRAVNALPALGTVEALALALPSLNASGTALYTAAVTLDAGAHAAVATAAAFRNTPAVGAIAAALDVTPWTSQSHADLASLLFTPRLVALRDVVNAAPGDLAGRLVAAATAAGRLLNDTEAAVVDPVQALASVVDQRGFVRLLGRLRQVRGAFSWVHGRAGSWARGCVVCRAGVWV
jgi:hypothetical protein